ncbi:glycosyltransferase involved in cell wall biosynthesis [Curtobacterium flaccumfaciens]|uniref:D-inositol 3-phosphate glycosyltransferase n=1 Tax=Curtobacterium salicis TaxID=1779862 RepID=A0ABX0T626_9MICO|nr:glycosyltransferase family 4 protein [Curtobacterium sp. WW7]NII40938.1 glycosyltransferase involved in cell wall biosynthesis [Curtobacterium sp. WW7]
MTTARVLAPWFAPAVDGGGPIRTLDALTRTAPDDIRVEVITRDRDRGATRRLPVPSGPVREARRVVEYVDTRGLVGAVRLARATARRPDPDVLYLNSVFDARFAVLPVVLRRLGLVAPGCTLLAPRGEFDAGALAIKHRKKQLFLAVARRTGLLAGITWHASTPIEASRIRVVVGADAEVVVRENETSLPDRARRTPPPRSSRLELVTLGRISPKKRTHLLIEALAHIGRPVRLVVIGPDDDAAYARRCRAAATALPATASVEFRGSLSHEDAMEALSQAHAMATATAGENFGHTIAEALSVGRPVLVSDTTPWSDRVRAGGGSVVLDGDWAATIGAWSRSGQEDLDRRASAAADAYDDWRAADRAPHVFDLVRRA